MLNIYRSGQKIRCSVLFAVEGVATDPTTVTFRYKSPSGVEVDSVYGAPGSIVSKDSTGAYHADMVPDEIGEWQFRFEGTGACEAVEESGFYVYGMFAPLGE